jgi:hypothetical protein
MSAIDNKQLMQAIFSELSKGNGKPFVEALASDIQWKPGWGQSTGPKPSMERNRSSTSY